MSLFGEKKFTISQSQLDKMNLVYNDMKKENERLKLIKENDDLLFDYEQENIKLRDELKEVKLELARTTKHLKTSESTMSAVLKKLDSTMKSAEHTTMVANLYKDMNNFHKPAIHLSNDELPFIS